MMVDYTYIFCAVLLCVLLWVNQHLGGTGKSGSALSYLIVLDIVSFIAVSIISGVKEPLGDAVSYIIILVGMYLWSGYILYSSNMTHKPLLYSCLTVIAAVTVIFYIFMNSDAVTRYSPVAVQNMFLILPIIVCFISSVTMYVICDRYWIKREMIQIFGVCVPIIIAGSASLYFNQTDISLIGLFVSVFLYFIILIDDRTILDVTGVYNSATISKYLSKAVLEDHGGKRIYISMCQVGGNKEVIDTYGHKEGNRVFQAFSDCLKDATVGTNVIVGRYWASKYVLIQLADDDKDLIDICIDIKERCFHIADGHPYDLRPCCAVGSVNRFDDLDKLMAEIEEEYLYDYLHVD